MAKKTVKKKRISPLPYIKAELQREIGSRCPFCPSEDVGHFEFHHIDGKRSRTVASNLLMLCRQCHSKFTKKEWKNSEAREKKRALLKDIEWSLYQSKDELYDYICHSMQVTNGRLPETTGNGSTAKVLVKDRYHFEITLVQKNDRNWKGELTLEQRDYGILFFRYQGNTEFEFGRRECYLKQITTTEYREDILYMKPLTDVKDYGDEIMRRRVLLI
jgi:hypothetical protein